MILKLSAYKGMALGSGPKITGVTGDLLEDYRKLKVVIADN